MRIGFNIQLKDKYLSGVERYSVGLVNSLCDFYPENEYFVFTNLPEYFKRSCRTILCKSVNRISRIIWEHTVLPKLAQKYNLDVLHCPHYICPLRKTIVPYVVTIHDTIAIQHPGWCTFLNAAYYRIFLRLAAKSADKVIAVSDETQAKVTGSLGVACSKVTTAYPGIDDCFFKDRLPEELTAIRDKYSLPDKYLLYVGNIEPKKNLKHVIDAFKLYRTYDPNCSLVIVGKRNWKSRKIFSLLRNIEGVILAGYLSDDELACVYRMANALLFPSRYEGFGFPPLEAMVSGTPVICTSNGALKETVSDAAIIVDYNKPISTYNAIVALNSSNELRGQLVSKGHITASRFSWSEAASQVVEIYRGVADAN